VPESSKGKLVAVGYSQPSFWPLDAIDAAAADARGKLALALGSTWRCSASTPRRPRPLRATISKEATEW